MPTALLEFGTAGGTAVLDSRLMIALKRTSVTGSFATPTVRCRSQPRALSRDTTGRRGFGWHKGLSASAEKLDGALMRAVRKVLAVLCLVLGAAFAFGAAEIILYSRHEDSDVWMPAIFAAIFLVVGFLLIRRLQATQTEPQQQR